MKKIARARGLGELKTATTRHIDCKQPRKGTTYLDLFSLSMERQRLEQELAGIERRRKRILDRLAEIQNPMAKLLVGQEERNSAQPSANTQVEASQQPQSRQWKKMSLEY